MQKKLKNQYNFGIRQTIINHIGKNIHIYFKVIIIFIIGICIGTIVVNQLPENELNSISVYINNSINVLKNNNDVPKIQILKISLVKNIFIVFLIWFLGLTLIGNLILYGSVLIIGITFGYTISSIMTTFTFIQGILFFFTAMLFQNIISIPSLIFLIVQGIKASKDLTNKQYNIKHIIIKYTMFSLITLILLILSSLVETYISGNLIFYIIKYL